MPPEIKQVVLREGQAHLVQVAPPAAAAGYVLVANVASVISSGTERSVLSGSGNESLFKRLIHNPDLIRKGLEHLRDAGVRRTFDAATGRSSPDIVPGYSSAGIVLDTGGIPSFRVGQLVACGGAGSASHAETVSVPGNLVAGVPEAVSARAAAFTTIGAIALQGVRRARPSLGERVVVVGLGLLGAITTQLLRAAGCSVFGVEPADRRRELAVSLGAEAAVAPGEAVEAVDCWSGGIGADAVLVTAATTGSAVINDAVRMLRAKGRVVPVGDVELSFERDPLYTREADVLISTSYGPGRYDSSYEVAGVDYPLPYVRWTENRNMQEVLRLLAIGSLQVESLIEVERPIEEVGGAYEALRRPDPPLAVLLTYDADSATRRGPKTRQSPLRSTALAASNGKSGDCVRIALIGAGSFVTNVHLPNIVANSGSEVILIANRTGASALAAARIVPEAHVTTDWREAVHREDVDLVVIGTRHDSHADIASAALLAGKAVLVEKPLGLSREEIDKVWTAGADNDRLAIGFNRPFSPLARTLFEELHQSTEMPLQVTYRVNAPLAHDHWLNDPAIGGGRLQGEACHMFDFLNWLCGVPERVSAAALPAPVELRTVESASVTVTYRNGSVGTVHYSGVGALSMPKERIEVFCAGRSWVLEDFSALTSFAPQGERTHGIRRQDKGHAALLAGVLAACRGKHPFEPGLSAAYAASSVSLAALESISAGRTVEVVLR